MTPETRHCTVYQGRGQEHLSVATKCDSSTHSAYWLRDIMSKHVVCARPDLELPAVVSLIVRFHVGCIPIVDESRRPIGMITELDVIELLDAELANGHIPLLAGRRAYEIMMPIALSLDENTKIADAASMIMAEETHHVLAVSADGVLVGVVSAKDVVGWALQRNCLV